MQFVRLVGEGEGHSLSFFACFLCMELECEGWSSSIHLGPKDASQH